METEKYYTPTAEDFYVGFEYENFVKHEGWTKRTLERLSDYGFNEKGFCIDHEDYRVKYLDEQDIIDLEFSSISGYYELYMEKYFQRENITARIFYEEDRIVNIEVGDKGSKASEFRTVFYGNVKNKSELKKILSMLGISE
jgi:hypothetical protein